MSHLTPMRLWLNIMFSRVPLVGVDDSLPKEVARADVPQIALPVSTSIPAVGDHVALTTAVANYSSFSIIIRYRPPCITL